MSTEGLLLTSGILLGIGFGIIIAAGIAWFNRR